MDEELTARQRFLECILVFESEFERMKFNDFVAADTRVEKVMLPLRDGLTIIRKK